ncbi:MAG TPA: JAB domain-containing protein [Spirochaetota bacterium]|nr:JAB domain-containing protein [Spirochaetota bacterium]
MKDLSTADLFLRCLEVKNNSKYKKLFNEVFKQYSVEKLSSKDILNNAVRRGAGSKIIEKIKTIMEINYRLGKNSSQHIAVNTPASAFSLVPTVRFATSETLRCLYLNVKNELIRAKNIARGSYNFIHISPGDIFITGLRCNARNIILVHNHPSADINPSEEDIIFTRKVEKGGKLLGINLVDHLIVNNLNFFSFKKEGLI